MIPLEKDEEPVDMTDLIEKMELGLKVIRITSVQTMQKRRFDLQYKLAAPTKQLAEFNHPFPNNMFGPNMKSDITNIVSMNKLTKKLTSSQKGQNRYNPFLGKRGYGRGHGLFYNNTNQFQGFQGQQFNQNPYQGQYYKQQNQYFQSNQNWGNYQQPPPPQQRSQHAPSNHGRGAHNMPKK